MLYRKALVVLTVAALGLGSQLSAESGSKELPASSGGQLVLDLRAGGDVEIDGTGGSSVSVDYDHSCRPRCTIEIAETSRGVEIRTAFVDSGNGNQNSNIDLRIRVPRYFDVDLDSMGGPLSIDGVEGTFEGKTMGGELTLHDVRGKARLKTMGGAITLTDSELDGSLDTMGGEVLFENVVGDVRGSSMGGNVRYRNVQRRDGALGSPSRTGDGIEDEITPETVTISTMGGEIRVPDAPDGADVHTMGGNIEVARADRFVRAKTMGGDIRIESIDGWVHAVTMAGDVEVNLTGQGGDVTLTSNSGDITLYVPSGFGMAMDLEIAYTRNSRKEYRIATPDSLSTTVSDNWDYDHGTPRKYIRANGTSSGGGHTVKVRTINGNITIEER